jgi:acyl-CoA reductase-like NAD-dependent aldehyde dehydrogenase
VKEALTLHALQINPATGQELWDVPIASDKDLNDAVAAAKKAFPAWRDTPIEKRKEALQKIADLFQQHNEEFTSLLCQESGKPVRATISLEYTTSSNTATEESRCH